MNLGLSPRGASELQSARKDASTKNSQSSASRVDEQKPDSFASVLKTQSPIGKEPRTNFDTRKGSFGAQKPESSTNTPSVQRAPSRDQDKEVNADSSEGVKKSEQIDNQNQPAKQKVSARQSAMLQFMDSMESEFGIPPQKLVEAMANLPQEKLLSEPEESAQQVIEQLDLPPGQAEQAMAMYSGLLQQLSQLKPEQAISEKPNPALQVGLSNSSAQKALQEKERREMLSNSLDKMNKKFFLSDRPQLTENVVDQIQYNQMMQGKSAIDKSSIDKSMIGNQLQDQVGSGQALPEGFQNKDIDQKQLDTLLTKLSTLGAAAGALGQVQPKAMQENAALASNDEGASALGDANNSGGSGLAALAGPGAFFKGSEEMNADSDSDSDANQSGGKSHLSASDLNHGLHQALHMNSEAGKPQSFGDLMAATAAGGMSATQAGQSNANQAANIEKLISQAKIVVQKGGGEAVVRMSPEGLGDVQMKVMVKDGKVNVEMATESKEAKKLIESSLADLKAGLGQHRLSVDHIKVDTGLSSSSDMNNPNRNPDFRQEPNRDQARQFFQNFHDENMSRRDPFMEMPGAKSYGRGQRQVAGVEGPNSSEIESKNRARVQGRGERMNLVA